MNRWILRALGIIPKRKLLPDPPVGSPAWRAMIMASDPESLARYDRGVKRAKEIGEFYHQQRIENWPRDPVNGRLLCAPSHPMPKDLSDHPWAHTGRVLDRDGEYRDWYRCRDCGHTWSEELPE